MSSIFLSCRCDSIITKLCCGSSCSVTEIHKAGKNCVDADIAHTICYSIVAIVLICTIGFLLWKLMEHFVNCFTENRKREWEKEDIQRKQVAGLIDKKLEILKELCYNPGAEEKPKKIIKNYDSNEVQEYLRALKAILILTSQNQHNAENK